MSAIFEAVWLLKVKFSSGEACVGLLTCWEKDQRGLLEEFVFCCRRSGEFRALGRPERFLLWVFPSVRKSFSGLAELQS